MAGKGKNVTRMFLILSFSCFLIFLTACSETDDEVNDYENWEARNEVFFAALEDSLANGSGTWMKIKNYSKNPSELVGSNLDYIYVKVLKTGYEKASETESPLFNDSVRISYIGRLMPSEKEPEGYVFDSTVFGNYDLKTNSTRDFKVSELVGGFVTAMIHMHRFETWQLYIPWKLGYGSSDSGIIPAYSTLIYTVTLYDFAAEGYALPTQIGIN